jgi:hypothetical protein
LKLGSLSTHIVDDPPVTLVLGVNWIRSPQLVALLFLAGDAEARIDEVEVLEAAGEEEVLVEGSALSQALPEILLEAVLQTVGGVISSFTAVDVEVR